FPTRRSSDLGPPKECIGGGESGGIPAVGSLPRRCSRFGCRMGGNAGFVGRFVPPDLAAADGVRRRSCKAPHTRCGGTGHLDPAGNEPPTRGGYEREMPGKTKRPAEGVPRAGRSVFIGSGGDYQWISTRVPMLETL